MKKTDLIKGVVKKSDPKPGFGSDPNDPWSAKANIKENITSRRSDLLKQFYKAMGYNITYVSKNQRVAKAKTGDFIKWKRQHGIYEEDLTTQIDHPEIRSKVKDSPTLKRKHELDRSAGHYAIPPASAPHSNGLRKESGEICQQCLSDPCICDDSHGFVEEKNMGISKASETKFHAKLDRLVHKTFGKRENESTMYDNPKTKINIPDMTEGVGDPQSATQPVADGANGWQEDGAPKKSVGKIVKGIVKKKMQEDLYDWEKDDKSTQPYGKKPSVTKIDGDKNIGDDKSDARLILKGGKTLTGHGRDTVEIDPMMKNRGKMPDYKNMSNVNQK
jgi:hypothetical protein